MAADMCRKSAKIQMETGAQRSASCIRLACANGSQTPLSSTLPPQEVIGALSQMTYLQTSEPSGSRCGSGKCKKSQRTSRDDRPEVAPKHVQTLIGNDHRVGRNSPHLLELPGGVFCDVIAYCALGGVGK